MLKKTQDLIKSLETLAKSFKKMSRLNKSLQVPNQYVLYQKVAKVLTGHSLALQNQGELIKIYCQQAMKYYKNDFEPF